MSQGSSVFHAESRALMNERVLSATPQETRPPCRMKVAVAPALFGAMANVGILEQIWRVNPIWSTTLILIRIFETWALYALMSALSRVHPGQVPYHIRNMMSAAWCALLFVFCENPLLSQCIEPWLARGRASPGPRPRAGYPSWPEAEAQTT